MPGARVTLNPMEGRAQNVSAVLRLLFGFVVLSTVAGLLMAGLAIPAVGATGQVAKGGVDFFNDLPSEFTVSPLAQQSRILDADGKLIANPYDENRIIVPLAKISKNMQNAQIAIEDARFYEHGGLDVRGFSRAMISNLQGGDVQGASTLTQQYVKITLQENALRRGDKEAAAAAVDKTYSRKLQELKYALNVEENFTKEQILEGYLNLVYYGDQAYGVEAAALNYFGVSAAKLNLGQAAVLAGTVQQPTAYNPVINPAAAQDRRNLVLDRMQALGLASAKDVAAAKKVDIKKLIKKKPVKGVCHRSSQPYFCAYVMEWLQKSPQMAVLGKTPAERLKAINQGGLTIRTTIKPAMQKSAQKELTKAVPINNKQNLAGAVTHHRAGHRQGARHGPGHRLQQVADQPQRRPEVRRRPQRLPDRLDRQDVRSRRGPRARHAPRVVDHHPGNQPGAAGRLRAVGDDRQVRHRRAVEGPQRHPHLRRADVAA